MSRQRQRRNAERRADAMIRRHTKGDTLDAIAKDYGISRQRVHEIIKWRKET